MGSLAVKGLGADFRLSRPNFFSHNDLGRGGGAPLDVSSYLTTTYNYFAIFWLFLMFSCVIVDLYDILVAYHTS